MQTKCPFCKKPVPEGKLRCPSCKTWLTEPASGDVSVDDTMLLRDVKSASYDRIQTGPWDACFGVDYKTKRAGIVTCSSVLLGGGYGSGKSTLVLQMADGAVASSGQEVLYLAAEEAIEQIKDRADRLGIDWQGRIRMKPAMSGTISVPELLTKYKPGLCVLDSINGLCKEDLSLTITVARAFKEFAMRHYVPALIIGQLNSAGEIAGLEALKHEVDTVLMFSKVDGAGAIPGSQEPPRILEVDKNRNGEVHSAVLAMTGKGLVPYVIPEDEDETGSDRAA